MCSLCDLLEDEDPSGCLEYGHEYVDCDCEDSCDMRVCIYCEDSY